MQPPATNSPPRATIEHDAWSAALRAMSAKPLEFCPQFPAIAKRFEAWWNHDVLDRPVFIASTDTNPLRKIAQRLELWNQPDAWLHEKFLDMRQMYNVGDALPFVRVAYGPVMLGGLFGGRVEAGPDTTWTHAFINDDWSNEPPWTIDEDAPLWRQIGTLARRVSEHAAGRYLFCTPDLGGSADVLLNLRGSEGLCADVLDQPHVVKRAVDAIFPAWRQMLVELYRIAIAAGTPIIHWLRLWSDRPYMLPACDFNYLIGPREFDALFLPDIDRQATAVGRACFHLDGIGAARHLDSLLSLPSLDAIQFTPGAQQPSALPWIEMIRKTQAAGKSALVLCLPGDLETLCEELSPQGLALFLLQVPPARQLDELFGRFCRRYGAKGNP